MTRIGYHSYHLEEVQYGFRGEAGILEDLKIDSQNLLNEIINQETATPDFKLEMFVSPEDN